MCHFRNNKDYSYIHEEKQSSFFDEWAIHLKKKKTNKQMCNQFKIQPNNTTPIQKQPTLHHKLYNEISKSASSRRQGPLTTTILKYRTPNTPKDSIFSYFEQNCNNCYIELCSSLPTSSFWPQPLQKIVFLDEY